MAGPRTATTPAVHVIVPTHTTRHLAACLAGLSRQTVMPASVAVSSDNDDPAIGALLRRAELPACRVVYVSRKHQGWPHLVQVRNNAVRALDELGRLPDRDVVLGIDGDIVLCPEGIERHAALAAEGSEMTIAFRVCLDEAATGGFAGYESVKVPPGDLASLRERDRRYRRQLAIRRVPLLGSMLVKPHKPKFIGAHYALTVGRYREVNGFDEEYTHYGYEDDDLARRLHAVGARCTIAVEAIPALHLWHPSRAPANPTEAPGYKRFCMKAPARAVHGLESGKPQPPVAVCVVRS